MAQPRIVSFNMHGETQNAPKFEQMLNGEHVICLQEVNDISGTRAAYPEYPYGYAVTNNTTKLFSNMETSIMILSKVPFRDYQETLVQTDPGGDKWERHAQYVALKTDTSKVLHLFNYHNTFNWHHNNSEYERRGLEKFVAWVKQVMGINDFSQATDLVLAGDFNLEKYQGADQLLSGLNVVSSTIDYVCGSMSIVSQGVYNTLSISDHMAPWAVVDTSINETAVVGRLVLIKNIYQNEYLYAADYDPYDKDRRRVFTWRQGIPVTQGDWRLEPESGDTVRLFNTYQREYLYASDTDTYDKDRRRTLTWRPGVPVKQGTWKIMDTGSGKTIYNTYQDEYLYAADYDPYDADRRRVFTWIPGDPVKQGDWELEDL